MAIIKPLSRSDQRHDTGSKSLPSFIINKNQQQNGDYEVHNTTTGCSFMPQVANQIALGIHTDCASAVRQAKQNWPNARINGCYYCCRPCHTS